MRQTGTFTTSNYKRRPINKESLFSLEANHHKLDNMHDENGRNNGKEESGGKKCRG